MIEGVTDANASHEAERPTDDDRLALELFMHGSEMIRAQYDASGDHPMYFKRYDDAGELALVAFHPLSKSVVVDIPSQKSWHSVGPHGNDGVIRIDSTAPAGEAGAQQQNFIGAEKVRRLFMWLTDAERY